MVNWLTPFHRPELRGIEPFQREMNRLLDSFFSDFGAAAPASGTIVPPMDVDETPESYVVRLEVPGIDPKDVNITVTGTELSIRGETRREEEKSEIDAYHRERRFGTFQRTISLPSSVAAERVAAVCRNGVLHLTLPKKEEAKPRTIKIDVAK